MLTVVLSLDSKSVPSRPPGAQVHTEIDDGLSGLPPSSLVAHTLVLLSGPCSSYDADRVFNEFSSGGGRSVSILCKVHGLAPRTALTIGSWGLISIESSSFQSNSVPGGAFNVKDLPGLLGNSNHGLKALCL